MRSGRNVLLSRDLRKERRNPPFSRDEYELVVMMLGEGLEESLCPSPVSRPDPRRWNRSPSLLGAGDVSKNGASEALRRS